MSELFKFSQPWVNGIDPRVDAGSTLNVVLMSDKRHMRSCDIKQTFNQILHKVACIRLTLRVLHINIKKKIIYMEYLYPELF